MLTSPFKKVKDWIEHIRDAGNITFFIADRWISISNYAVVVKPCRARLFAFYLGIGGVGTSGITLSISDDVDGDVAFEVHLYGEAGFMLETVSLETPRKKVVRIWGLTRNREGFEGWFGEPVGKTFCKEHGLPFFDRD